MRRTRLIPVVAVLGMVPFALGATGAEAKRSTAKPVFRTYTSPVGAQGHDGIPTTNLPHTKNYSQEGIGDSCGEPSVGVDTKTGAVLYQCGLQTLRVTGFDAKGPGSATWTDVTGGAEGYQTSDPILYVDPRTNRTFVNQLELQGCSLQAYTDNDGASWTPSALGCGPGIAFDHQTVAAGPPAKGSPLTPVGYPDFVYYCTNDILATDCAVSADGGESFLPAHPVDANGTCSPLTGHLKTAADGTVYLPVSGCGAAASEGVYVSTDNATSWTLRGVPGSTSGNGGDNSVAVGKDGTVYFVYASGDAAAVAPKGGRAHVVVSTDRGQHWSHDSALGKDVGVTQIRFPEAVAGDGDRAAVAFLGTTAKGNSNDPKFTGVWHVYVSYTFDRGKTWKTYDATPNAPVQYGEICTLGTAGCLDAATQTSPDRNLLDFMDATVDKSGAVVVGFADGCLKTTCTTKDRLAKGAVIRQVGGPRLYR